MTILIVSLLAVVGVSGLSTQSPSWIHTRPVTPLAAWIVADAGVRAPLVWSMLESLERSDVFVYVSHHVAVEPLAPAGYLRFVVSAGGRRYLWIQINCWQTNQTDRISWLAHELQHALEIANAAEVQDDEGLLRFYRRIGFEVGARQFETRAARAMGALVRAQLATIR